MGVRMHKRKLGKGIRMNKSNYEIDCLGIVEADRQYAISRLETVHAASVHVIEHLDRIDITVIKRREQQK